MRIGCACVSVHTVLDPRAATWPNHISSQRVHVHRPHTLITFYCSVTEHRYSASSNYYSFFAGGKGTGGLATGGSITGDDTTGGNASGGSATVYSACTFYNTTGGSATEGERLCFFLVLYVVGQTSLLYAGCE